MGLCNCPPCLRNRLLPKSVHSALEVLGVTDTVTVDLQDLGARTNESWRAGLILRVVQKALHCL